VVGADQCKRTVEKLLFPMTTTGTRVFIVAVDSTDRINFSNQQLYLAVRLDGLLCIWRHTTI